MILKDQRWRWADCDVKAIIEVIAVGANNYNQCLIKQSDRISGYLSVGNVNMWGTIPQFADSGKVYSNIWNRLIGQEKE